MRIRMDNTREPVETGCYLARDCFTCPFRDCMAASGRLRKDRRAPQRAGRAKEQKERETKHAETEKRRVQEQSVHRPSAVCRL